MPVVTLNYTTYHMHCRLPLKTFAVLYRSRTQETGSTHTEMKAKKIPFPYEGGLGAVLGVKSVNPISTRGKDYAHLARLSDGPAFPFLF
mgnify:CR=1 FL=1